MGTRFCSAGMLAEKRPHVSVEGRAAALHPLL